MCGQWGDKGVTRSDDSLYIGKELEKEELRGLIDSISSFKPNITLFGGEPLLYPHCIELIEYIKKKGLHALMVTNGTMLKEVAGSLVKSGLDELNVSLDGAGERHDAIRGQQGIFSRIMQGLAEIQRHKKERKTTRPLVNIQCTINSQNYSFLSEMIEVAGQTGADSLTFHHLVFLNKELIEKQRDCASLLATDGRAWEGFVFDPGIDPESLNEEFERIASLKHAFSVEVYPRFSKDEILKYYRNIAEKSFDYGGRCVSPWIVAYIFPDGEVRPCLNFRYSFGNIRTKGFSEIWNSEEAIRYRSLLRNKKVFPVCLRCTELYRY